MPNLSPNLSFDTYGKTRVRLLQVLRSGAVHEVVEIIVTILFEGKLADSYIAGDNSRVLPTDTMKNTVYALARQHPIESIEQFAMTLGTHFLARVPHLSQVKLEISQVPWERIGSHGGAFAQATKEERTTQMTVNRERHSLVSGLRNLHILKTSHSAFFGYMKDEYTTLPETRDRLLGTVLDVDWTFANQPQDQNFNAMHSAIRSTLLDSFATHESLSVQHTLYAMGQAVLDRFEPVKQIHLKMPNKHCLLFDLSRFGLDNPNQIFVPTDEPSGYIEACLTR